MSNSLYGILFTFLVGVFFVIILFISNYLNSKKNFLTFLLGLTFSVMLGMVVFGLLPETLEIFEDNKNKYLIIAILSFIGFFLTLLIDKFIPDHHDSKDSKNLMHISIMTTIAIVIHNFVEGSSLYLVTLNDIKSGFLMFLAILLHNIPFALTIMLALKDNNKKTKIILLTLLSISTLLGGVFICLFTLEEIILGSLICLTLGMILYISLFEILHEIIKNRKNKYNILGVLVGIIIVILLFL